MSDPGAPRPVFVVGAPRTDVAAMAARVSRLTGLDGSPEADLFAPFEQMFTQWAALRQHGHDRSWWYQRMASFIDDARTNDGASTARRWVDHSPGLALRLPFVETLFPRGQVIHVVGDPRTMMRRARHHAGRRQAARLAQGWARANAAACAWGAQSGRDRYRMVRMEDLVLDPEPTLRDLVGYLGEPWEDGMLGGDLDGRTTEVAGGLGPILERVYRFRAGRLATDLGYEGTSS